MMKKGIILFVFLRMISVFYAPIPDCDETFNFWEPTHYLSHGFGERTWEYDPIYALRSFLFLLPLSFFSSILVMMTPRITIFYVLRSIIAMLILACDYLLCLSEEESSEYLLALLAVLPGPSLQASPSYLPTTLAMAIQSLSLYLIYRRKRKYDFIACFVIGFGLVASGWPFAGAAFIPHGLLSCYSNGLISTGLVTLAGVLLALALSYLIDGYYFGRDIVIPSANIVIYNVLSSDRGPDLYVEESLSHRFISFFNICIFLFTVDNSNSTNLLSKRSLKDTVWNLGVSTLLISS